MSSNQRRICHGRNGKDERSPVKAFTDWIKHNHQQQPSLGAELKALGREGLKDLQNAVLHAFPDSMRLHEEPGAPLSPTQAMVTKDVGTVYGFQDVLDGYASRGTGHGHEQDKGLERAETAAVTVVTWLSRRKKYAHN